MSLTICPAGGHKDCPNIRRSYKSIVFAAVVFFALSAMSGAIFGPNNITLIGGLAAGVLLSWIYSR